MRRVTGGAGSACSTLRVRTTPMSVKALVRVAGRPRRFEPLDWKSTRLVWMRHPGPTPVG